MILVRNSPHNNGIYTFIDIEAEIVIKSSINVEGIGRLKREFYGYQWYLKLAGKQTQKAIYIDPNPSERYCRIYGQYFLGKVGNSNRSLSVNYPLIEQAIKHYIEIWPTNKSILAPLHGDFSVGNLIFNEDMVTIIDWEHFAMNVAPWGFDLVNMFYESVYFSMAKCCTLKPADKNAFFELRSTISELLKEVPEFDCNLTELIAFMRRNELFWGSIIRKMPVLKFTREQQKFIEFLEKK
jgi:hypothetical protein